MLFKYTMANLINIVLESCRYIGQSKRHYLRLEMIILGPECCFLFVFFINFYLLINTN